MCYCNVYDYDIITLVCVWFSTLLLHDQTEWNLASLSMFFVPFVDWVALHQCNNRYISISARVRETGQRVKRK